MPTRAKKMSVGERFVLKRLRILNPSLSLAMFQTDAVFCGERIEASDIDAAIRIAVREAWERGYCAGIHKYRGNAVLEQQDRSRIEQKYGVRLGGSR